MNNIAVANETIKITSEGLYEKDGKRVELPMKLSMEKI